MPVTKGSLQSCAITRAYAADHSWLRHLSIISAALVCVTGAGMAAAGVLAGAAFGFVLARLAGRYFLDVKMPGAWPVTVSALLLMTVALIASVLPAARAARVDVMQALRSE